MKQVSASLLALLSLGSLASADASNNYTAQLLSSGTIKLGDWQDAYDKASAFVKTLSTSDKLSLVVGGEVGNFTGLHMLDSSSNPLGYYYVTNWPAGLAMVMTWDNDAIHKQAKALGSEFRGKGINLAYAPTLEPLGRSAWGGRQGETYGPDSYFAGAMRGRFVKGISDAGVIPSTKHFIMNEYETNREGTTSMGGGGGGPGGAPPNKRRRQATNGTVLDNSTSSSSDAYTVHIDDKAYHETYLAPFYDTVKNGMGGAMCAMNRVNGLYSCESQDLLAKYLKVELGFPGIVHADISGQRTAINSANAGMDYSSQNTWSNSTLGVAVNNGSVTTARLDDMAIRNMMGYFHLNQDQGYPDYASNTDYVEVRRNHAELARTCAASSVVLLTNKNSALPLKSKRSISIFGSHAAPRYFGPNTELDVYGGVGPTMQGHMAVVGGSGMGSLAYLTTPIQLFNERAAKDGFQLRWWLNDTSTTSSSGGVAGSGTELKESTVGVTANSDACVVFLNAWAGEGGDRSELTNGTTDALVNTVADNCNNTIVVINTVGPRLVDAWIEHDNVTGVLYGGALGQESGNALDDVLFGAVNPSGRLVHTIAKNESDYDANTRVQEDNLELDFSEGNYIDYKYFDQQAIEPRYAFGYGLSYTTFEYGSRVTAQLSSGGNKRTMGGYSTGARAVRGREDLWDIVATVTTTVMNTGGVAGAEVAQLYLSFPDAAGEPARQLRGFEKVVLEPYKTATVTFELRRRDLSVWDTAAQNWKMESGDYVFHVAASSRDLRANATLTIQSGVSLYGEYGLE
ncbi:Uu.00g027410.m01.CDS01 [Anthostomella pinea]|uniref:beta-glucosidase n=1 Tax=Anthostomella pinea TaxID=933095 RepID=A0AAI8V7S1_9PEZI|nr:Uu.00g027410.m01.CDS01 [Anthostomella pinea]